MALMIASSVASTVAPNSVLIWELLSTVTSVVGRAAAAPAFAVENATKMSPEPFPEMPPVRATPKDARRAILLSWWGRRGRVSGNHNDDGAPALPFEVDLDRGTGFGPGAVLSFPGELPPHRNAGDGQPTPTV